MDRKANVRACVYIVDLVTARIKEASEAFHGQLAEGFLNDVMCGIYTGTVGTCSREMKGVMSVRQAVTVDSLSIFTYSLRLIPPRL